jgi:hypothetical protein
MSIRLVNNADVDNADVDNADTAPSPGAKKDSP